MFYDINYSLLAVYLFSLSSIWVYIALKDSYFFYIDKEIHWSLGSSFKAIALLAANLCSIRPFGEGQGFIAIGLWKYQLWNLFIRLISWFLLVDYEHASRSSYYHWLICHFLFLLDPSQVLIFPFEPNFQPDEFICFDYWFYCC